MGQSMKRAGLEETAADAGPLFDRSAAWNRAEVSMARASSRAERLQDGWRASALEAVRAWAADHAHFLAEDVPHQLPSGADGRAWGAVMRDAVQAGLVTRDGYAPAQTSNRSPKTRWRSLIHMEAR